MQGLDAERWRRHRRINRLQSVVLIAALMGICAVAGGLLFGQEGLWLALLAGLIALLFEPATTAVLTLRLYGARPLGVDEAPGIHWLLQALSERAGLPTAPVPYYVASSVVNAFATGSRRHSAVAVTDGLLRTLTPRELAGVLAHEVAHIAHDDLRVMGLADYVSRLTQLLAGVGQVLLIALLPFVLMGSVQVNLMGLATIILSPQLALLVQLGLSRTREFDADLAAARLTGDPGGLASALAKIEQVNRGWLAWLLPGWGNPEPSWLRTHPTTQARIARLRELAQEAQPWPAWQPVAALPARPRPHPRWRFSGLWH